MAFACVELKPWGDLIGGCVEWDVEGMHRLPGSVHVDHGVDLYLRKIIETGRLAVVVMERLVGHLRLASRPRVAETHHRHKHQGQSDQRVSGSVRGVGSE